MNRGVCGFYPNISLLTGILFLHLYIFFPSISVSFFFSYLLLYITDLEFYAYTRINLLVIMIISGGRDGLSSYQNICGGNLSWRCCVVLCCVVWLGGASPRSRGNVLIYGVLTEAIIMANIPSPPSSSRFLPFWVCFGSILENMCTSIPAIWLASSSPISFTTLFFI